MLMKGIQKLINTKVDRNNIFNTYKKARRLKCKIFKLIFFMFFSFYNNKYRSIIVMTEKASHREAPLQITTRSLLNWNDSLKLWVNILLRVLRTWKLCFKDKSFQDHLKVGSKYREIDIASPIVYLYLIWPFSGADSL